jgi:uncharacterized protein YuzE
LDDEANALYFRFNSGEVARTVELTDSLFVDVDADGKTIGLECLDADEFFPMLRRRGGGLEVPQYA